MRNLAASGSGSSSSRIPTRAEVPVEHRWAVERLYAEPGLWDKEFEQVEAAIAPVEAMRGALNSPENIARMFEEETKLDRLLERLYTYAHLRADEDTADPEHQARLARIKSRITEAAGRLAWITPELLSHSEEDLRRWADSPELKENRYAVIRLLRRKPHTLSEREETLLSRAGEIFDAPHQAFSFLTNADMRFPDVVDSEGKKTPLSEGRYHRFLINPDRRVRKDAFAGILDTYGSFRNTIAGTLASNLKVHNYLAAGRNFGSALEAALHDDNIPLSLYDALIRATHEGLPAFHRYLQLRRERLRLDDMDMYDMYVPIVPDFRMEVPYEQATQWVIESCAPLGDDYVAMLKTAFADRWVDIYENKGKRSGAYASGCYDSMPYVLMNYADTLDSVFTLAHELGHAMHSKLANLSQPHRFARYPIFTAEIASTLNEELLVRHLLKKADDPRFRAYLLNHECDAYKGTVYRQTMFAEFEKMVHELDAQGRPLTPDFLCDVYYKLNAEYYGLQVKADRRIALEWARIPHFYYDFYVYKYATSFCASQLFVQQVLSGAEGRDRYLGLLKAGGSADPLDLVRDAGVDLADSQTVVRAFDSFEATIKELEQVLDTIPAQ